MLSLQDWAKGWIEEKDADSDGRVSFDEYVEIMKPEILKVCTCGALVEWLLSGLDGPC